MLKKYAEVFQRLFILSDFILIGLSFLLSYFIRKHLNGLFPAELYFFKFYVWIFPVVSFMWVYTMYVMRLYESFRLKRIAEIVVTIIQSAFFSFSLFTAVAYIFKSERISRSYMLCFFVTAVVLMLVEKIGLVFALRRLRLSGHNFRNILVAGTGRRAKSFMSYLTHHRELGLKIIGLLDEDPFLTGSHVRSHRVLGTYDDIGPILQRHVVDYVFFIVPRSSLNKIEYALKQCELMGVTASVAVDLFDLNFTQGRETSMLGIPMITFETTPPNVAALLFKRALDLAISGTALILISPVYLILSLIIKLSSPGPVYFVQERCGLNGRTFKLYKFRTMVQDAEARLKDLLIYNEMKGHAFKMENDPRITKIGKFLRKFSLDELPQLWNVFHGDMSLVGPRPPLPREVRRYDAWHQRRLSMRPGITCLWQVGGRNRIRDFDEWVRMDLQYIDNWSLYLDLKIMLKTIPAVLSTSGAK